MPATAADTVAWAIADPDTRRIVTGAWCDLLLLTLMDHSPPLKTRHPTVMGTIHVNKGCCESATTRGPGPCSQAQVTGSINTSSEESGRGRDTVTPAPMRAAPLSIRSAVAPIS